MKNKNKIIPNPDLPLATQHFDVTTFDEYAELYENLFLLPYRSKLELPTLEVLLGDLTGLTILDFGCGSGIITRWLHDKGAEKVFGYDISEGMLHFAKKKEEESGKGITYLSAIDESHYNKFDIVLAIYVIPYLPDRESLLELAKTMTNLLKAGGRLITLPIHPNFNPNPEYYRKYGFRLTEKVPRSDGSPIDLHLCFPPYNVNIEARYWSEETLNNILCQAGLNTIRWQKLLPPDPQNNELDDYLNVPHAAIIEAIKNH
ncbi:class I SAM-dependent methyltransferase [Candidatus Symbiopectobacterium sp. NZEC135]|uniref:class I SAM-dependent methyltransferase n=1 Tax=Candidatus Symbiopectobacterium sp. NZEC135 TaxID=2820471 RepID=UPI0022269CE6|nr:class I SAM-dependent methyltransferase [Candidatus Symbiopectobacterium sp. NZEC135]MCW2481592.1 class I SAM-dependent methyltransferase [Candidatus Symbiopectobacterium sp. NZEC135]